MELDQEAGLVISLLIMLGALAMLARRVRLPYPVLFVLGALLSPTDAVAVVAVGEHVHIPTGPRRSWKPRACSTMPAVWCCTGSR
jgi:hypothetical protein